MRIGSRNWIESVIRVVSTMTLVLLMSGSAQAEEDEGTVPPAYILKTKILRGPGLLIYTLENLGTEWVKSCGDKKLDPVSGDYYWDCGDGRVIWEQPKGPSWWNELCGQTAVANVVSHCCEALVSPTDPAIVEACHNGLLDKLIPGTTPGQLIEVLENFTEQDYECEYCPNNKIFREPISYEDLLEDVEACQLPAIALLHEGHSGAHYVTIDRIETVGDETYVYLLSWGNEIKMTFAKFHELYIYNNGVVPIMSGLICTNAEQAAGTM